MRTFTRVFLSAGILMGLLAPFPVAAESGEIEALREEILRLRQRVEELESERDRSGPVRRDPYSSPFGSGRPHSWDPFEQMRRMQEEMDRIFQSGNSLSFGSGFPSGGMSGMTQLVTQEETDDAYLITIKTGDLNKEKIDIEINESSVTIQAEREERQEDKDSQRYSLRASSASFMQTFPLPTDADTSRLTTEERGDTLVLTIPKMK